jgi:hypothetical protein
LFEVASSRRGIETFVLLREPLARETIFARLSVIGCVAGFRHFSTGRVGA